MESNAYPFPNICYISKNINYTSNERSTTMEKVAPAAAIHVK